MKTLAVLARDLDDCRRRHQRLTLRYILEAARILVKAKKIASGGFTSWLQTQAKFDGATARRYMQVSRFVAQHRAALHGAALLSLTKFCKLASLPFADARKYLRGALRLSKPLSALTDRQFMREMNRRHPSLSRRTGSQAHRAVFSALKRLESSLQNAARFRHQLSAAQRRMLEGEWAKLKHLLSGWRRIA